MQIALKVGDGLLGLSWCVRNVTALQGTEATMDGVTPARWHSIDYGGVAEGSTDEVAAPLPINDDTLPNDSYNGDRTARDSSNYVATKHPPEAGTSA